MATIKELALEGKRKKLQGLISEHPMLLSEGLVVLQKFHDEVVDGLELDNEGICIHWADRLIMATALGYDLVADFTITMVAYLSTSWPDSVNPGVYMVFPVQECREEDAWEGGNRVARIDLMQHVLNQLRNWE